jgi:SAM-dependent methyltransferase
MASDNTKEATSFLQAAVDEGLHSTPTKLNRYVTWLFDRVAFEGISMLDVGGGTGLFSLYASFMGANDVTILEPGLAGSDQAALTRFNRLEDRLDLHPVLSALPFQDYQADGQTFDLILLHNSVNHLDEDACTQIGHDADARAQYGALFAKLATLAKPNATIILTDATSSNFWPLVHLTNPFARTIEWHKHQPPAVWQAMLEQQGFSQARLRWSTFNTLGTPGRRLLGNRVASYFLNGHFALEMRLTNSPKESGNQA